MLLVSVDDEHGFNRRLRGYSQIQGVDYTQSFSATLRATSMRTLLALAAGESLSLEHFDVTSAFTQSDIDCDIYVEPPKGYPMKTTDGRDAVLKLKRALYGTKQASRLWQQRLAGHLENKMGCPDMSGHSNATLPERPCRAFTRYATAHML